MMQLYKKLKIPPNALFHGQVYVDYVNTSRLYWLWSNTPWK